MSVEFNVRGVAVTQGSKKAWVNKHTGRASMTEVSADKLKLWRHSISDEARKAMGSQPIMDGPVEVEIAFALTKPASAPKRRRTWPIGARSGDVDKLARAALDALTGVIFNDDSQVIYLSVGKDYGEPGAHIYVRQIKETE